MTSGFAWKIEFSLALLPITANVVFEAGALNYEPKRIHDLDIPDYNPEVQLGNLGCVLCESNVLHLADSCVLVLNQKCTEL